MAFFSMTGNRHLVGWVCSGPGLIYEAVLDMVLGSDGVSVRLSMGMMGAGLGFSLCGASSSRRL